MAGFSSAYNQYWNQDTDDEYGISENSTMYNHVLYTNYMSKPITSDGKVAKGLITRRQYEWLLFKTGYYANTKKFWQPGGEILEKAYELHKHMEDNKYKYYTDTNVALPTTVEKAWATPSTCCATYVSWVLYECGYDIASNIHYAPTLYDFYKNIFISVTYDELQPGDIVFMTSGSSGGGIGHVQIYAGDGQWYNAGSTSAIQRTNPYSMGDSYVKSRFLYALRPI